MRLRRTDDEAGNAILAGGIIAIMRALSMEVLVPAAEAVREGGISAIEVAVDAPGVLQAFAAVKANLGRDVLLGAGAILEVEAAREAIRAGAGFIATPHCDPEIIRMSAEAGVPIIPGAFTPTEILQARNLGTSLVKVFPAGAAGPRYFREVVAAVSDVRLMAAGGISLANIGDFIYAGAAAVGVGEDMIPGDSLARQDRAEIKRRARAFSEAVQRARVQATYPVQPLRPIEGPDIR